jgi:pimeloyl-ACP methyl ester carboxylesterase
MTQFFVRAFSSRVFITTLSGVLAILWSVMWTSQAYGGERERTVSGNETNGPVSSLAIDDGLFVDINGTPQWITIRGRSANNPVILFLHGGPGMALSGLAPLFSAWEEHYTFVQWDQPNSGSTYIKNMASGQGPLTIERYVRDGIAVTRYLRERLGKKQIVLLSTSWGSMLGIEMIKKSPELFSAYVGTAQVVNGPEGDKLGYEMALQAARVRGDAAAIKALQQIAPPFESLESFLVRQQYTNPPGLPASAAEHAANAAFVKVMSTPAPADARYIAYRSLPPDFNATKMFMDALRGVYAERRVWNARDLGLKFDVPMFIFQGDNDLNTPLSLARDYLNEVEAPRKELVVVEGASHNTIVFQAELLRLMNTHVKPVLGLYQSESDERTSKGAGR